MNKKRIQQHLELFPNTIELEDYKGVIVNTKEMDQNTDKLMWISTKGSPNEGFDIYEPSINHKSWFDELIEKGKIKEEDIKNVYMIDLPKTEQKVLVKLDMIKGKIQYFDNETYENNEDNLYWQKPEKYNLLTLTNEFYNKLNLEKKELNNLNKKNSEGMKFIIQSLFLKEDKKLENIDYIEELKDNASIILFGTKYGMESYQGNPTEEEEFLYQGLNKDEIKIEIKAQEERINYMKNDIYSIKNEIIKIEETIEGTLEDKTLLRLERRLHRRKNTLKEKEIELKQVEEEFLALKSKPAIFRDFMINFGFPLIGDKMIKLLILDDFRENKNNQNNSLEKIFTKLMDIDLTLRKNVGGKEINNILKYLNGKTNVIESIHLDQEDINYLKTFKEDLPNIEIKKSIENFKLTEEQSKLFYNFIFQSSIHFRKFDTMVINLNGKETIIDFETFEKNFKNNFNLFVEKNINEILTTEKLFPAVLAKEIKETIENKNEYNRCFVTDCRDEQELKTILNIDKENSNFIVIIPFTKDNELNLRGNKEEIIELYKANSFDGFIQKSINSGLVQGAEEMNTLFVVHEYIRKYDEDNLNKEIERHIEKKFSKPQIIENKFGDLYILSTQVKDIIKDMNKKDIKVSSLVTISAGGKDTVFSIIEALKNKSFTKDLNETHEELIKTIDDFDINKDIKILKKSINDIENIKDIFISKLGIEKKDNIEFLFETTLKEVYMKEIEKKINQEIKIDKLKDMKFP